ncbi:MAG TPA: tetratricopeptide repeat protein [Candidatus Deferrimicrobiaceae bacterium]|jgi:hypothetical protein
MTGKNATTRAARSGAIIISAVFALQACVPYTSNYKPDPTRTAVVTGIEPSAATTKSTALEWTGIPSESAPDAPITIRAIQRRTGPAIETTRLFEQQYQNYWTPAIIPLGIIGVAMAPAFLILSPIIDYGPDRPGKMTVFGGWSEKHCDPKGLMLGYLIFSVGYVPTCQPLGDPRITESTRPLGRETTESLPLPGARLRIALAEQGGAVATPALTLETDGNGLATVPLGPLFLSLPDTVRNVEAVASVEGAPTVVARAPISAGVVQALAGPARAERDGDRAAAGGNGLIALEHYTRAATMGRGTAVNRDLRKKIAATYRALPVKPPVSEDTRRLVVQAETLAKANDAVGAAEKLSAAIRTAPWLPVARYNMAMVHAMAGDYDAAIDAMNVYLELAPDAKDARQAKDKIYEWEALKPATPAQDAADSGGRLPPNNRPGRNRR